MSSPPPRERGWMWSTSKLFARPRRGARRVLHLAHVPPHIQYTSSTTRAGSASRDITPAVRISELSPVDSCGSHAPAIGRRAVLHVRIVAQSCTSGWTGCRGSAGDVHSTESGLFGSLAGSAEESFPVMDGGTRRPGL